MTGKNRQMRGAKGKARQNKSSLRSIERKEAKDLFKPRDIIRATRSPELKHLDVNSGGYISGVSYAGTITALSAVGQGVAGNQRVGDAISVRGVHIQAAAYAQGSSEFIRFIAFQWNMPSSIGAPTAANVLQNVGVTAQTIACPYDFTSAEQGRLNVLADFTLRAASSASTPDLHRVTWQGELTVNFDAGSTTASGQIYLLAISDAALAANAPVHQWWARLLYDDI